MQNMQEGRKMQKDEGHGDKWVEDMASLVFTVLLIVCIVGVFGGLYWLVVTR